MRGGGARGAGGEEEGGGVVGGVEEGVGDEEGRGCEFWGGLGIGEGGQGGREGGRGELNALVLLVKPVGYEVIFAVTGGLCVELEDGDPEGEVVEGEGWGEVELGDAVVGEEFSEVGGGGGGIDGEDGVTEGADVTVGEDFECEGAGGGEDAGEVGVGALEGGVREGVGGGVVVGAGDNGGDGGERFAQLAGGVVGGASLRGEGLPRSAITAHGLGLLVGERETLTGGAKFSLLWVRGAQEVRAHPRVVGKEDALKSSRQQMQILALIGVINNVEGREKSL